MQEIKICKVGAQIDIRRHFANKVSQKFLQRNYETVNIHICTNMPSNTIHMYGRLGDGVRAAQSLFVV